MSDRKVREKRERWGIRGVRMKGKRGAHAGMEWENVLSNNSTLKEGVFAS